MVIELLALCKAEEVKEGSPIGVQPEGFPALAVYNVAGKYFATDELCSHGNANLSEGFQEGDVIECPFHGGAFCIRTGEPTALPCVTPIKTYRTVVQDGMIYIAPQANADAE